MKPSATAGKCCSDRSFTHICAILFSALGVLFFLLIFIGSLFFGATDSILPDRFPKHVSLICIVISVLLLSLAAVALNRRVRIVSVIRQPYVYVIFFAVSVCISCVLIFNTAIVPQSDFNTYYKLAEGIIHGEPFIPQYVSAFPHTITVSFLLAGVFKIFGASVTVAQITGACLSALSVLLIYAVGCRLYGRGIGSLAALIWMINPSRVIYSGIVCTENLFNLLAPAIFLLLLKAANSKKAVLSVLLFALCGVLNAMLAAIRPNGLVFLIAFIMLYLIFIKVRAALVFNKPAFLKGRSLLKPACIASMIAAYLLTGILYNAAIEANIGMDITENRFGYTFCVGMNKDSLGRWNAEDSQLFGSLLNKKGSTAMADEMQQIGFDRLSELAADFSLPGFIYDKTCIMWCIDHEAFLYASRAQDTAKASIILDGRNKVVMLSMNVFYYSLLLLAVAYVINCLKAGSHDTAALSGCLIMLGTFAMHILCEVAPRYKNSVLPWLCLLAACGIFRFGRSRICKNNSPAVR